MRLAMGLSLGGLLLLCSGSAAAQQKADVPATQAARADALFEEGSRLFEAGKFAEACEKLDESQRLDPALGTEFNLAECWQKVGRLLKAKAAFEDVVGIAHSAGKSELEQRSRERLARLETEIPRVVVGVGAPSPEKVSIDGVVRPSRELAAGVQVDPGEHKVEASGAGKQAYRTAFSVVAGARTTVQIPPMVDAKPAGDVSAPPDEPRSDGSTQRTIAFVSLGVGAVGLVVGGIFGGISLSKHSSASDACPDPKGCETEAGVDAWKSARSAGNVSTVAFIVGGVGVAAGAVLWLTAPKASGAKVGVNGRGPVVRFDW